MQVAGATLPTHFIHKKVGPNHKFLRPRGVNPGEINCDPAPTGVCLFSVPTLKLDLRFHRRICTFLLNTIFSHVFALEYFDRRERSFVFALKFLLNHAIFP